MDLYALDHLSNQELFRGLNTAASADRTNMAVLLAHLAEFDARRLFASAGYSSMFTYCVDALHFSEPEAAKRIHVARTARRFPILFSALASGRLHPTAIGLLAPHLSDACVDELVEAASHRSKYAIETLLARRFPDALPKVKTAVLIRAVSPPSAAAIEVAPAPLFDSPARRTEPEHAPSSPKPSTSPEPAAPSTRRDTQTSVDVPERHKEHPPEDVARWTQSPAPPDAADCFLIRVTVPRRTYDKLHEAQVLLSHAVRLRDVAEVLDRALDALIALLKRRKIGSDSETARIASAGAPAAKGDGRKGDGRYIPTSIRRAVWDRDKGQCTFVSADGHRCGERRFLEFDHAEPVARSGSVTIETVRLLCRAHNQHEAERVFGAGFMDRKRGEARAARQLPRNSNESDS